MSGVQMSYTSPLVRGSSPRSCRLFGLAFNADDRRTCRLYVREAIKSDSRVSDSGVT